jgi:hypothetical protein
MLQPGQYWERVYKALAPFNRTVLGGRVPGVGVGGFIAGGGGYSWMSNQYVSNPLCFLCMIRCKR